MSIITVSRKDFLDRYESPETRKVVSKALKKWDQFLASRGWGEADAFASMRMPGNQRYVMLDQFSRFPCNETWLIYVKAWIRYNDITLDADKVKQFVRRPKKMREREKGIDRDTVRRIVAELNPFYRVLVLVAVSSGMRIRSEVLNMEWEWIDFKTSPPQVTIPAPYTKMKQERITFLTGEAVREIMRLPRKDRRVFPKSYEAFYAHLSRIRDRLGLDERKVNGLFQFKPHRFRGYAEHQISREVGEEFAHAIIGHGAYLGQYFAGGTTDAEAAKDFKRAEKALTVYEPSNDTPVAAPGADPAEGQVRVLSGTDKPADPQGQAGGKAEEHNAER